MKETHYKVLVFIFTILGLLGWAYVLFIDWKLAIAIFFMVTLNNIEQNNR